MEFLDGLMQIAGSGLFGGALGLLGSVVQHWMKKQERQQELEHEREMAEISIREMQAESKMRLDEYDKRIEASRVENEAKLALKAEETAAETFTASIKSDSATWSTAYVGQTSRWVQNIIALMMGSVDFARGLIRPAITVGSVMMVYLIWRDVNGIVGGFGAMSHDQAYTIWHTIIIAAINLATTAFSWWFGSRLLNQRGK